MPAASWIALSLPCLALDILQRGLAAEPEGDCAATARAVCWQRGILQANAAALALGVQPGLSRATALALVPWLPVHERDPEAEQQALGQIACWGLQFTPRLLVEAPDHNDGSRAAILLDVGASLRLFGGLQPLLDRIRHGVALLGFTARLACAPTPVAASLLARWHDGVIVGSDAQLAMALADLPLSLLASLSRQSELLESMGLRCFRDLARLPRDGIARRFGAATLTEVDQALDRQPDLRAPFDAPLQFASTLELPCDIETTQAVLHAASRQLRELSGWLLARHCAVRRLLIEARHERTRRDRFGPVTAIDVRFADPTADPERMVAVLREHLAMLTLPSAVYALHLSCQEIVTRQVGHGELFPTPVGTEESLGRLVERLQARLGREQVQRVLLASDHRPEAAYRFQAIGPKQERSSPALPDCPGGRPLWLLEQPVPLAERSQRPWWNGPLTLLAGPERIECGWWDQRLVQRDYFIAEDEQARWVWIYRTRGRPMAQDDPQGWFLQGVFG